MGWTKTKEYAETRYRVMLEVIKPDVSKKISMLDFGCGGSHLLDFAERVGMGNLEYSGLDLSEKFLELSRRKYPDITYYHLDLLEDPTQLPDFDYVVLNGVFNYKGELSFDEMLEYVQTMIAKAFHKARNAIAFNVMSKQVDWEREDLFHLSFDLLASFLTKNVSRHFVFRHDYGLYEYTVYVYHE